MSDGSTQTVTLLGGVPLFSGLDKPRLRRLAESAKERTVPGGEILVREGEKGIGFYLILSGDATVERQGHRVATLGPGQFFGEMALLDDQPRSADVRATTPLKCLVLSSWEFWAAVGDEPEVLRTLLKETVRRIRSAPTSLSE